MNATDLRRYAAERATEARRTLAEHGTEAYTGICRSCGRPGPCDAQRAARAWLAHYGGTVDDLRAAWLVTLAAADRAGAQLHGAVPPGRRVPWQDAVVECWRALNLAYAVPDEQGGSAGELLAELGRARLDAELATALIGVVRHRLGAAEDRLRRTGGAAELVAARRLGAARHRLDLAAARLAVGGRRVDRYTANLAGRPEPEPPPPPATGAVTAVAVGTRSAVRLIAARRRRQRPGPLGLLRDQTRRRPREDTW
ncbi:hypothetical protein ACIG87_08245 [Micromonospora sp. NPDC051925]|uniref:hypothetical protein n=1 Tax=Micromonospora sp. NPDC051925 TaxID=3364288 RepID=UPI0037CB8803